MKDKLPAEDLKKYIERRGTICLNKDCTSHKEGVYDIEGGSIEIDGDEAWQEVSCSDCGWEWTDCYKLYTVVNVKDCEGNNLELEEEDDTEGQ